MDSIFIFAKENSKLTAKQTVWIKEQNPIKWISNPCNLLSITIFYIYVIIQLYANMKWNKNDKVNIYWIS